MKNKQLLIAIAVLAVIAIGGGVYMLSSKNTKTSSVTSEGMVEESVPVLSASELGLTMSARGDNKAVKFVIANAKDITGVDYELSYVTKGDIPRGAIGHVEPLGTKMESTFIDLGTCSSGKCKYDEGVTSVKLFLKIMKSDGKSYQADMTLNL